LIISIQNVKWLPTKKLIHMFVAREFIIFHLPKREFHANQDIHMFVAREFHANQELLLFQTLLT